MLLDLFNRNYGKVNQVLAGEKGDENQWKNQWSGCRRSKSLVSFIFVFVADNTELCLFLFNPLPRVTPLPAAKYVSGMTQ